MAASEEASEAERQGVTWALESGLPLPWLSPGRSFCPRGSPVPLPAGAGREGRARRSEGLDPCGSLHSLPQYLLSPDAEPGTDQGREHNGEQTDQGPALVVATFSG